MKSKCEMNDLYEEDDEFRYLQYKKLNEYITRVDKYSIYRYWEDSEGEEQREMLFYPSTYGFEQIENMENSIMEDKAAAFKVRVEQLKKYGNAQWHVNVNEEVGPHTLKKKIREVRKLKRDIFGCPTRKLLR